MSVITATQFNQQPSQIKALSEHEPVFVTDRGRVTTVVMSLSEYDRLRQARLPCSLGDALVADDDLEIEVSRDRSLGRIPDLGD